MDTRPTVALTGASGFVGSMLVPRLLTAGYRVRALLRSPERCADHPGLSKVAGSLETPDSLETLARGSHCLVHLAAAIAGRNRQDFEKVNVHGTRRLVEAMEQANPDCRLIHVSSLAARLPSISDYAYSKRASEETVKESRLEWLILRPPAVYGPADRALAPLWRALAGGWLVQAGPAESRFSLLHVDDLCEALVRLIERPWPAHRVACLDDGRSGGYCWSDLDELAGRVRGRRGRILKLPGFLLSLVAGGNLAASRLTGHAPMLTPGKVRELTHPDWVCGDNLADLLPDWRPQRRLETALAELPGWRNRF